MRGFLAFLGDGGDDMVMAEGSGRWWQAAADGRGGEGSLQDITQRGSRGGVRRRKKKEKEGGRGRGGRRKREEEDVGRRRRGRVKGSCGRECFENLGAPHFDISYLFIINVNVFLNAIKFGGMWSSSLWQSCKSLGAPRWQFLLRLKSTIIPRIYGTDSATFRRNNYPHIDSAP